MAIHVVMFANALRCCAVCIRQKYCCRVFMIDQTIDGSTAKIAQSLQPNKQKQTNRDTKKDRKKEKIIAKGVNFYV